RCRPPRRALGFRSGAPSGNGARSGRGCARSSTVTPEQWSVIEREFEALAPLSPGEREVYLARLRSADPATADVLARMLRSDASDPFLQADDPPDPPSVPGDYPSFSNYRVLSVIGAGPMSTVFKARQLRPKRHVALKVLRGGRDSQREADALAG